MKNLVKGYFKRNLGDDLFLKILAERYPNEKFEVYSSDTYNGVYKTKNIKFHSTKNWLNIIRVLINKIFKMLGIKKNLLIEDLKRYDNIILIGGSIFMENDNMDFDMYAKRMFNYKYNNYILGANFGPYHTEEFVNVHKKQIFPNLKDICFRDVYSFDLFKELKNVRHASDIVFGLNVSKIGKESNNIAIISIIDVTKDNMNYSQEKYNNSIKKIITFLKSKGMKIILMSFSKSQGDEIVINQIISSLEDKTNVESYFYRGNIEESLDILSRSKVVFGTRFHANILGLLLGKNVVPIAYSDKTINVFNDMNFKGKIFDIRDDDMFNVDELNENDINYLHDVTFQITDAKRHFEALDKIFYKEEK